MEKLHKEKLEDCIRSFVKLIRNRAPETAVHFELKIGGDEHQFAFTHKEPEQLRAAGVSMKNLDGEWIKEAKKDTQLILEDEEKELEHVGSIVVELKRVVKSSGGDLKTVWADLPGLLQTTIFGVLVRQNIEETRLEQGAFRVEYLSPEGHCVGHIGLIHGKQYFKKLV